jgi:iron complex transport system substrate-binding protein
MRIVSLLPAATEIGGVLGLMKNVVGVSHECDFPEEANAKPRVTHCPIHDAGLTSRKVDEWVRKALYHNGTIYTIDDKLMRDLRPDVILTQKLCDVCAVGYGTVARLAATLPGFAQVVNLEPSSLSDILDDVRRVARACGVSQRGEKVVKELSKRIESVRARTSGIAHKPTCFLMEWIEPPFCCGHWGPELVEIAGGHDPLGRKHEPSAEIKWEAVLNARPEVIILALCGYDVGVARRDYKLLKKFPGFSSLPAAQSGRVYAVDAKAYFSRPGPRIVDSLEILASILHPEQFPEFTFAGVDRPVLRVADM